MSISTSGWRGLLAVTATCVFAGACTGDDDDAETTGEAAGTTAAAATTSGPGTSEETGTATGTATAEDTTAPTTTPEDTGVTVAQTGDRLQAVQDAGVVRCGSRDELPGFNFLDATGELPAAFVGREELIDPFREIAPRQASAVGLRVLPESFDVEHLPHTFT